PGERSLLVWRRLEDDRLERTEEPFSPWLLTPEPNAKLGAGFEELATGEYRFLYQFPSWGDFQAALSYVRDSHVDHFAYASAGKQALVRTAKPPSKARTWPQRDG